MKYRADIDGLRAIAILWVVIFHAYPTLLPGGFIGVDVFFVISGYLISTILFTNLNQGTFSLTTFYARRIRRIFPALIIVLMATLVMGWYQLLADEMATLSNYAASSTIFMINFLLCNKISYFNDSANTTPLLHLWSLAVEEQFYLIWPIALYLSWRGKYPLLTLTLILAAFSMIANLSLLEFKSSNAAFFWPIGRFWELMMGAVLAWCHLHQPRHALSLHKIHPDLLATTGYVLLFIGAFGLNEALDFPGFWALIPTTAAYLIIASGTRSTLNRRILTNRAMMGLGLISYPLYLWHWPLISFLHIQAIKTPPSGMLALALLCSLVLATLTYWFIEKPIRKRQANRSVVLPLSMLILLIGLLSFWIKYEHGFDQRQTTIGISHRDLIEMSNLNKSLTTPHPTSPKSLQMLLWGDSYAGHLVPAMHTGKRTIGFALKQHFECAPILNYANQGRHKKAYWQKSCMQVNDEAIAWLKAHPEVEYVAMASPFIYTKTVMIGDKHKAGSDVLMRQSLTHTIERIRDMGRKPVIIAPTPRSGYDNAHCWRRKRLENRTEDCDFLLKDVDNITLEVMARMKKMESVAPVVYLSDFICPNGICHVSVDGLPLYRDKGHLTPSGSWAWGHHIDLAGAIIKAADDFWKEKT